MTSFFIGDGINGFAEYLLREIMGAAHQREFTLYRIPGGSANENDKIAGCVVLKVCNKTMEHAPVL